MGQKMKGHLLEPIPRLRDLRDDIPQELDDLYARLLEKEPMQRLITAEETATLLKTIAQRPTTKASPASFFGNGGSACPSDVGRFPWFRRHAVVDGRGRHGDGCQT